MGQSSAVVNSFRYFFSLFFRWPGQSLHLAHIVPTSHGGGGGGSVIPPFF
jgi:hypothetical protein